MRSRDKGHEDGCHLEMCRIVAFLISIYSVLVGRFFKKTKRDEEGLSCPWRRLNNSLRILYEALWGGIPAEGLSNRIAAGPGIT